MLCIGDVTFVRLVLTERLESRVPTYQQCTLPYVTFSIASVRLEPPPGSSYKSNKPVDFTHSNPRKRTQMRRHAGVIGWKGDGNVSFRYALAFITLSEGLFRIRPPAAR